MPLLHRWANGMTALLITVLLVTAPEQRAAPQATEPAAETTEKARRNAISFRPFAVIPHFGFDLGYERALGRRFSVGGRFGYFIPRAGYAHLQGFEETLFGRLWIPRALHGVYAEASLGVAHQVLVRTPKLSKTSLVPGLAMGGRWQLANGLLLGASAGLRWGVVVADERLICTPTTPCPAARRGVHAKLAVEVGYAF